MVVNNNIPALQTYNAVNSTTNSLQKSIQKLSRGLRINSAADDAAGLAISEKMRAQVRGLDRAVSNSQDGISMLQTAEGALSETHSILQRMRELSVQASNDTLTQQDRSYIQLEIDQLREEVTRIGNTTQFNKKKLLDGSAAVLWSASNLETKAIVKGGLRSIDQFGQKTVAEGNYKINVTANPGSGEVKKTDIFKIKHEDVIMNVSLNEQKGVKGLRVEGLPAGSYKVWADEALTHGGRNAITTATAAWTAAVTGYGGDTTNTRLVGYYSSQGIQAGHRNSKNGLIPTDVFAVTSTDVNASILAEVTEVDEGAKTVTFRLTASILKTDGTVENHVQDNVVVTAKTPATANSPVLGTEAAQWTTTASGSGKSELGFNFAVFIDEKAFAKGTTPGSSNYQKIDYAKGDKMVYNVVATQNATTVVDTNIKINGTQNLDWPDKWADMNLRSGGVQPTTPSAPEDYEVTERYLMYGMNKNAIAGKDIHFRNFYLNTSNGTVYEGDIVLSLDKSFKNATFMNTITQPTTLATFDAAYVGQVAEGDVKLRDLDKFWNSEGRFLLTDPQTITLTQGDGKQASITLYQNDTLESFTAKLNKAIGQDLGQNKYTTASNPFARFTNGKDANGNKIDSGAFSTGGTIVISSVVTGAIGKLSFAGDEDLIKALSMNVLPGHEARESDYRVSITDAHSGQVVTTNQQVTGNKLIGMIHENIDVEFDSMIGVAATVSTDGYFTYTAEAQDVYLHLADNTTVYQIGANEGEDMGINLGDMRAEALGLNAVLVTDRASAARSITVIDNAIDKISMQRAKIGAYQNRLEHTINNLTVASENLTAAESRIRDTDMAKEMMKFTKLQIMLQAGTSMLAQANQLPQNVLSLLR
ncbi:MAG: flagellin [Synergistaceae bacterium]|nr:flagellin [Synergistaceae bacterium]